MAGSVSGGAITLFFLLLFSPCLALNEDVYLIQFKDSLMSSASLDSTWIIGTNPCDPTRKWLGVDCYGKKNNNSTVTSLLLMNLGLSGSSPAINIDTLFNLESLRVISLENNNFSGPIPKFNRLTSLKSLFLSKNQFSGEIPQGYFQDMGSLKRVHLDRNRFSGRIPLSLTRIDSLTEIHLQKNMFSGHVPEFNQKSLMVIDFSNNDLEGKIPGSMARFPATAFDGNPNLCGSVISRECVQNAATSPLAEGTKSHTTKWLLLGIIVAILLITILFKVKREDDDSNNFPVLPKEVQNPDDVVVQVHAPSLSRKASVNTSRRKASFSDAGNVSSKTGLMSGKSIHDLVIINDEKGVFRLTDLMMAEAEVLGNGALGFSYRATMANVVSVVVKRMGDVGFSRDEFDAEVKKLGNVRHRNVLPLLAYHYRKEEKLLVHEYIAGGSLLMLLHGDRGETGHIISWPTRLKIIKGVARGMRYLHTEFAGRGAPHGNLKSSNILLSSNYEPLLTDYGLYGLVKAAPCVQSLSACRVPDEEISPKSDVYCLGIVIAEIMTRKFPAQYLNDQNRGTDVVRWVREAVSSGALSEVIDPEITNASSQESIGRMEEILRIGAACTESDREVRIEMREAIRRIEEIQI